MPYCPSCKAEVNESDTVCAHCGEALKKFVEISDKEAFLVSVNTGIESEMVEGSLRSADIPFLVKGHGGPEGFVRYDTKYESSGADFYVPSKLLKKAIQSLPPDIAEQADMPDENEADDSGDSNILRTGDEKTQSPVKQMLTVVVLLILIALVVFGVDSIMNIVRTFMGYR
ncbi:MAG TPA: zinc ribbon domain-containing protein [Ruminiclostridium sp.]|nr:zinc ribbon domain-containing protein [Ruminiclostridium sp.]